MPQFNEDAVRFRLGIESARLDGQAVTLPPQIMPVRAGPHDAPPLRLSSGWRYFLERACQSVPEAIYERVEYRQLAGVLAALVVGDQNAIERADWDVFRATGVAHLMGISGLHITMFAWVASLLIGKLWRRSARLTPRLQIDRSGPFFTFFFAHS